MKMRTFWNGLRGMTFSLLLAGGLSQTGVYASAESSAADESAEETAEAEMYETEQKEDGTYAEVPVINGVYYGNYVTYETDEKSSILDSSLYVNGKALDEIKEQAAALTYDLIAEKGYVDRYVYVDGTVELVYQSRDSIYFRIRTEELGMIISTAGNAAGSQVMQHYIPNLTEGQQVRLYGYYNGLQTNECPTDELYYGFSQISFDTWYCENTEKETGTATDTAAQNAEAQNSDALQQYTDLQQNPFADYGMAREGSFQIDRVVQDGGIYTLYAEEETGEGSFPYVLSLETYENPLLLPGMTITVDGYMNGQHKADMDFACLYPDLEELEKTIDFTLDYSVLSTVSSAYEIIDVDEADPEDSDEDIEEEAAVSGSSAHNEQITLLPLIRVTEFSAE